MNDDRLRSDCGLLSLPGIALAVITGEDRKDWLQGQVTNDVRSLDPGNSVSFCLCSATGQIQSVIDAWGFEGRIAMTTDRETLPAFLRRAEEMVIMEDVAAGEATSDFHLISIQGPTATERLSKLMSLPDASAGETLVEGVPVLCMQSDRTGFGGWDLWVPRSARDVIHKVELEFEPVTAEAFNAARLEAGIPMFGVDIHAKTMPPELGPSFEAKHVSYKKGCYVGQEVLMRIHSRGHTNKTWVGLLADGPLEVGGEVHGAGQGAVGVLTSVAESPTFGHIGGATVRNEVASNGESLRVITERGEVDVEVRILPLTL
ncbi:YgfZ/GcvT domain-containing protein [Fimbriimonas ginsengisoli]|uniref:Folate-dependent protein for Fe/S cluster synthesis/repair in oxidative stress n=1 Tax=Fimbriimonas ginsengisoli Gsoil 348 TaxID=661478 RepID=A0A068NYQ8_FIMGI|nr:folate-binding protein YgfZ [Fimbriimonas ginsengisoli]AIE87249.1 Folate-dependent protein for Fe/S cluster synthesis/repair in oxidative stress [Fimbriimonas ginsengisoli Gsoil 348]